MTTKDVVPTPEQQVKLVNEAPERMVGYARSWLDNSKVKVALNQLKPAETEVLKAS